MPQKMNVETWNGWVAVMAAELDYLLEATCLDDGPGRDK